MDDESLLSLCVRKLAPHGNLHLLRSALELTGTSLPTWEDLPVLATMLEIDVAEATFKFAGARRGPPRRSCIAEAPTLPAHLRRSNPQLCVACVHETGYCKLAWELSLFTACPLHGIRLIDVCERCRAPLRWDRPAVDVCRCKRPLRGGRIEADANALTVATALEHLLNGKRLALDGVAPFFAHLTAPGASAVIHSFGEATLAFQRTLSSVSKRAMDNRYWSDVCRRAVERLQMWRDGVDVAPYVNSATLSAYARMAASAGDADVVAQLIPRGDRHRSQGMNAVQGDLYE